MTEKDDKLIGIQINRPVYRGDDDEQDNNDDDHHQQNATSTTGSQDDKSIAAQTINSGMSSITGSFPGTHFTPNSRRTRSTRSSSHQRTATTTIPGRGRRKRLNQSSAFHKLNFSKINRLYGREKDVEQLQTLVDEELLSTSSGRDRCFLLIEGISGSGKSALARKLEYMVQEPITSTTTTIRNDKPTQQEIQCDNNVNNNTSNNQEVIKADSKAACGGVYCMGKFDLLSVAGSATAGTLATGAAAAQPLSAIQTAITMMVENILKKPPTIFEQIKAKLSQELGSEIYILAKIFPDVLTLAGRETTMGEDDNDNDNNIKNHEFSEGKEGMDQFNYAIRKLMEIVTQVIPVVIVCDDLQWSDYTSLEILKSWLFNVEIKSLMVVGIYRKNEYINSNNTDVTKLIQDVTACSEERSITVQKMTLKNLTAADLEEYLKDMLSLRSKEDSSSAANDDSTKSLAEVLVKKTGGNPFQVQQYLMTLINEDLLTYNPNYNNDRNNSDTTTATKWSWDEEAIRLSSVSENIAVLMKARLRDNTVGRRILPIAACLGSTFSLAALKTILEYHADATSCLEKSEGGGGGANNDEASSAISSRSSDFISSCFGGPDLLMQDLMECVEEGFVEQRGEKYFAFVHDKVQEAALALVPDEDIVKFRIGEILWRHYGKEEQEEHLFEIIGLLSGKLEMILHNTDAATKYKLAKLFYAGGRKAQGVAAYREAGGYYKVAIDNLVSFTTWKDDQTFCIDLYSYAAETDYNGGRFEQMQVYASRVLSVSDCPMWKKIRVCFVLLQSYSTTEDKNNLAVDFAVDTLAALGCNIPKSKGGIMYATMTGLLACKLSGPKVTPEFVDKLPITNDPVQLAIMKMLDGCVFPFYSLKPELLPIICIKMHKVTMKHGITPYSAYSFCFLGFIFTHFLSDPIAGRQYADHALALAEKYRGVYSFREIEPKLMFMIYSTLWHWTNLLSMDERIFFDIYQKGMRVGDCGTGMTSIFCYLEMALYIGRDLESIDRDVVNYMNQTIDFKQEKVYHFLEVLLQCVRNLRGIKSGDDETTTLTGTVMNEKEKITHYVSMDDKLLLSHIYKRKLLLATYFGEYELGAELAIEHGDNMLKAQIAQSSIPVIVYNASLCCFAAARNMKSTSSTRSNRYQKYARKYRRMIKKWRQTNPNCAPYILVLDAEKAALNGKHDDAAEQYEKTILLNERSGLVPEHALANERLAYLYLDDNRNEDAKNRFETAIQIYNKWKASAKARKLQAFVDKMF